MPSFRRPHAWLPLAAALLFGASTPFAKALAAHANPLVLAGLLYLGSGLGLLAWREFARALGRRERREAPLRPSDLPWLGGAVLAGGVAAPVLLLVGLRAVPAATASLLLSLEGVFTAALAWWAFGEPLDRRLAAGMAAIGAGGAILAWSPDAALGFSWGALAVAAACLAWAVDNNLTRRIAAGDPLQVAAAKGLAAGALNLVLGLTSGGRLPGPGVAAAAAAVGLAGYGVSLVLFVLSLRHLGAARTAAYFSVAPFAGAGIALLFPGERVTASLLAGGLLTGAGVWLHLTERHGHEHAHPPGSHEHAHGHAAPPAPGPGGGPDPGPHSHRHGHAGGVHAHPHYPDLDHRHRHP